jgi:methyl-accepting chemotaxis protein
MRWTVGKKLGFGFFLILVFLGMIGGTATTKMMDMGTKAKEIQTIHMPSVQLLGDMKADVTNIERLALRFVLERDTKEREALESQIHAGITQLLERLDKLHSILQSDEEEQVYKSLIQHEQSIETLLVTLLKAVKDNEMVTVEKMAKELQSPFSNALKAINQLIDINEQTSDAELTESIRQYESGRRTVDLLSILALVMGIILSIVMTRLISRPLVRMAAATKRIAAGDLSSEDILVNSKDELNDLAASFNAMKQNLRNVLQEVSARTEQVAGSAQELSAHSEQIRHATGQIAATMEDVAAGADNQAGSIQESQLSFHEVAAGMQHIAVHVEGVTAAVLQASDQAAQGNQTIETTVTQMNAIHDSVVGLAQSVHGLGKRSQEIDQIIGVITGIAKQTNLLALNAAIEAARVGESGSGFAVVAKEVRKLAEQSAQSAEQIAELIHAIQVETSQAIDQMESGTREVEEGIHAVNLAGESFRHIQQSVDAVVGQMQEVSAATEQMSASTEQVKHSFQLISDIADRTSSGTEQVAAAVQQQLGSMEQITASTVVMAELSGGLQGLIQRFKL